jgi:hypothetical protein
MLDEQLAPTVRRQWRGHELPFPILLDATGKTFEDYGMTRWMDVLIDPDGRIVDVPQQQTVFDTQEFLSAKLPPLPTKVRVARALERVIATRAEDGETIGDAVNALATLGRIRIQLDPAELKAVRADGRTLVPLSVGGRHTLRAWLNLTLDPFGLTYIAEGDGLRIVRRTSGNAELSRPSRRQDADNAFVAEVLKTKVTFDFRNESLKRIAASLMATTGESFALDPVARQSGSLRPEAVATGSAIDEPLGCALKRLLDPLNVTYVVRDETILLTPRGQ